MYQGVFGAILWERGVLYMDETKVDFQKITQALLHHLEHHIYPVSKLVKFLDAGTTILKRGTLSLQIQQKERSIECIVLDQTNFKESLL